MVDEPGSHLHIALQREILPYFVKCFSNAQFIVATHSSFATTSLSNATLFNTENRECLNAGFNTIFL
ncbi:MAG: ATP-binding protein [Oscillospiraceae bacterium]|nr:ATP-binding protein [Oscillospiraceae bacterium]